MRYYTTDLRDALWGAERRTPTSNTGWMGVRRLRSWIMGLPPDSAYARASAPEAVEFREATAEFLALAVETLDAQRKDFYALNAKDYKRPEPFHIRRPWEPPEHIKTGSDLFSFIQAAGR
jgi:hypothetical protein